jgi:hypothetical protein
MSEKSATAANEEADGLVPAVGELVDAVLGLGVTITRSVARAADGRERVGAGSVPASAVEEIVRNGAAAIAGIVRMAAGGISGSRTQHSEPPAGAAQAPFPTVSAGGTLRMPLFIENPSPEPTGELEFVALSAVGPDGSEGLTSARIRCIPHPLVIGARDFEKLTVLVDTMADTPRGRHRLSVGAEGTPFATVVEFDVVS